MKILGIETSCDETAAAVVENGAKILSSVVASSARLHAETGGIIPEVAAREQIKDIIPVIDKALGQAGNKIDTIAVTVGPGLIGSLLVGVETAKTLSFAWGKPIIPVNHLLAHLYANWLGEEKPPQFPALAFVISGGHTDLALMKNHGQVKWLGGTRDDAAGECFDKSARALGLAYPGGPAIAAAASTITKTPASTKLPRPMIDSPDLDFSFSGLKTAVVYKIKKLKEKGQFNELVVNQLAFEVQEAIGDVLVKKTVWAAQKHKVKSILLAGGVTANGRLREKMRSALGELSPPLYIPQPKLCTDNAAYIAAAAYFIPKPTPWKKIQAVPGLSIEEKV